MDTEQDLLKDFRDDKLRQEDEIARLLADFAIKWGVCIGKVSYGLIAEKSRFSITIIL